MIDLVASDGPLLVDVAREGEPTRRFRVTSRVVWTATEVTRG